MATLDQIKPDGPILLDAAQHDLDRAGMVVGLNGANTITLEDEDVTTFLRWAADHWRPEFERDLQSLATHKDYGDLLTTEQPLVVFREDLCVRAIPRSDEKIAELMDRLRLGMREWREAGADTVVISGCDGRLKS